jgi:hypothetical protein
VKIAIKAQYRANQGGNAEPKGDVEGVQVHSGTDNMSHRLAVTSGRL